MNQIKKTLKVFLAQNQWKMQEKDPTKFDLIYFFNFTNLSSYIKIKIFTFFEER